MDITILFSTRIIRLFCYGFLSVVLALYLSEAGLTDSQIGLLFTLTLAGDAVISLWLTTSADRFGRKRTLILGALLMAGAGLAFVLTRNAILLVIAAIVGVISPSGNEIVRSCRWNRPAWLNWFLTKRGHGFLHGMRWWVRLHSHRRIGGRLARPGLAGQ